MLAFSPIFAYLRLFDLTALVVFPATFSCPRVQSHLFLHQDTTKPPYLYEGFTVSNLTFDPEPVRLNKMIQWTLDRKLRFIFKDESSSQIATASALGASYHVHPPYADNLNLEAQ
jgi:hypothetical protein